MKIIATIEARMTSSRLPGKVLLESCGKPLLQHMIERIRRSRKVDDVVVATTINAEDDPVVNLCKKIDCHYFRGSEDDVLVRVLEAAKEYNADLIVETTGDCPLIDWRHIDHLVDVYMSDRYDYVSNCTERSFPDGFDIRVFSTDALDEVNRLTKDPLDHEHVAIYFPNHPEQFRNFNWKAEGIEYDPSLEVTLDELGDYKLLDSIFSALYLNNPDFSCRDVIEFLNCHSDLLEYTNGIKRTVL